MKEFILAVVQSFIRRTSPVKWRNLRSVSPVSPIFGVERGVPIDRFYIEHFLKEYKDQIRGDILEIGDDRYIRKFGSEVSSSYVLRYQAEKSFKKDDLTDIQSLPQKKFDCVICEQTLHCIFDLKSAIHGLNYLLKENGILLVTLPSISQISVSDMGRYGDYWRFTAKSAEVLFHKEFPECDIKIHSYGNVLTCISFLEGIGAEELTKEELLFRDLNYNLLIGVAVRKPAKIE